MCVLTYLPLADCGFILTSNRDEATSRSNALPPRQYFIDNEAVYYPKDPIGGGTWIATHSRFTVCLLNGAGQKHIPEPSYKHSRGKVVLDFFTFESAQIFFNDYCFDGLEPFTLIIIDDKNADEIYQIRWDGTLPTYQSFDASQPRIWSSVTLYSDDVISQREHYFEDFLFNNSPYGPDEILHFHHFGGGQDIQNKLLMNRNDKLKTVSITQILKSDVEHTIRYEDLQNNRFHRYRIFESITKFIS